MSDKWPAPPAFGEATPAAYPSQQARDLIGLRRSTAADLLTGPGPDDALLADMLCAAARAPDHRRVSPFRFVVFAGERRALAGDVLAAAFSNENPSIDQAKIDVERRRFLRAPVVVLVVSSVDKSHRTPAWEQVLTAGAVCQNLLLTASASGFAAQWLTEWYAYSEAVNDAFGLGEDERVAGYVYIGTASEQPKERQRPNMASLIRRY